jgi:archaetidylinositol phosphate synthase
MLKEKFSAFQSSVGSALSFIPLTPNQLTAISVLFAIGCFLSLASGLIAPAIACFLIAVFLDMIDGAIARAKKMATAKGAYLDGVADRFVEFFVLFGLVLFGLPDFILPAFIWLFIILFFGSCMTAFCKAYADHRGALSKEKLSRFGGMFNRAERMALLFLVLLLAAPWPSASSALLAIIAALSVMSVAEIILYVWISSE